MKYLSLRLENYIRLANGLGTPNIFIDFSKQKFRTCIIRGENGSGKSTIFNALSVMPDSNDSFIPGLPAKKEIYIKDDNIIYIITFIHGIKNNGERDTTKAYFKKVYSNGETIELNENGNINSYKDILYQELKLDSNFIALSQLSMDDKGLATKRPAERKRFVNSIISSLDVYNNIYKSLNKTSSVYKTMVNSIVSKLGQLGDEKLLESSLSAISSKITQISSQKDQLIEQLGIYKAQVQTIDKDGILQSQLLSEKSIYDKSIENIKKIDKAIEYIYTKNSIDMTLVIEDELNKIKDKLNRLKINNELLNNNISTLLKQREEISKEKLDKEYTIENINIESNPEEIRSDIDSYTEKMNIIKKSFNDIGIYDLDSISKDEYILALQTIQSVQENIELIKSDIDFELFSTAINIIINDIQQEDILKAKIDLDNLKSEYKSQEEYLNELLDKLKCIKVLSIRPEKCNIDDCPFICDAVKYNSENIINQVELQTAKVNSYRLSIEQKEIEYNKLIELNTVINNLNNIIRYIKSYSNILQKLPNGSIYNNPKELFIRLLNNQQAFEEIMSIYKYIDLANNLDLYKKYESIIIDLSSKIELVSTKYNMLQSYRNNIDILKQKIISIDSDIKDNNINISKNNISIMDIENLISIYEKIINLKIEKEQESLISSTSFMNIKILEDKLKTVKSSIEGITNIQSLLVVSEQELSKLNNERDHINYSLKMYKEYKQEYDQLSSEYNYIETIKYYASPTTGIQLIFMEMYMGKIISLANELLSILFNGKFTIQQFIINESEFRIPCITSDNYLIDDISSMSSAQVSMISMILSFSLLYHSSTKYNIIKLDEIDAPLDENNRLMFIDVLNKIMDIMKTEQCIMISHNSELQIDTSDVVLLKNNNLSSDYNRGNIIWSL